MKKILITVIRSAVGAIVAVAIVCAILWLATPAALYLNRKLKEVDQWQFLFVRAPVYFALGVCFIGAIAVYFLAPLLATMIAIGIAAAEASTSPDRAVRVALKTTRATVVLTGTLVLLWLAWPWLLRIAPFPNLETDQNIATFRWIYGSINLVIGFLLTASMWRNDEELALHQ